MEFAVQGFRGVFRQTDAPELEKVMPNFLARGRDVCSDLHGNLYVVTGTKALTAALSGSPRDIHYSYATGKIHCARDNGDFLTVDPADGSVIVTAGAFAANARFRYADWPQTSLVYVTDGTNYRKCNAAGTVTDVGGLGIGTELFAHKNTMFSVQPGANKNQVAPSALNDPETFSSVDFLTFSGDGNGVTALVEVNGVLYAHKQAGMSAIFGDAFAGTAKNVQIRPVPVNRGAVAANGVWSEDGLMYFVGYDGLYRGNGSQVERISRSLDGLLNGVWSTPPTKASVTFYSPLWGPDAGNRYVLYLWQDVDTSQDRLWRYNIDTGDWMELSIVDTDTPVAATYDSMVHSRTQLKTYFLGSKVYQADNVSTHDGVAITGDVITNVMDAGTRTSQKLWNWLHEYPCDTNGLSSWIGLDGVFPSLPLAPTVWGESALEMPRPCSHLLQARFAKTGGGQQIVSGFVMAAQVDANRRGRDAGSGRKEAVQWMVDNGASYLRVGSVTLAAAQTTAIVTHGCTDIPEAVYACQAGFAVNQYVTVSTITRTQFTLTVNGYAPVGGEVIYWMAILDGKRFWDSYARGRRNSVAAANKFVQHNLDQTPDAVFIGKASGANKQVRPDTIDGRQFRMVPEAAHPVATVYWMAFKSGTDTYFKSGRATSSPIAHGLGVAPRAAFLYPDQATIPNFGITSVSSTEIVYSGTGAYWWVAVK